MSRKMRTERAKSLYNSISSNEMSQAGSVDYEVFTDQLDRYLEKLKVAQRELELKLSSVKSSLMAAEEDSNSLISENSDTFEPDVEIGEFEVNNVTDTSFEPVDDESIYALKTDRYVNCIFFS